VQAERIAALLKENMGGSGVKTVVIDSLISILTPLVVEAILDNDAGRNKNRVAVFKNKALAMRLLQDTVTGWGCDVLWIYHLRSGMDGHAKQVESTTIAKRAQSAISVVELARLRRSLNMQLRIVQDGHTPAALCGTQGGDGDKRRGVHVDWARRRRSGLTLWYDSDGWRGMPERIERAVYGGLTPAQMDDLEQQAPISFSGPEAAIAWGYEQRCFKDAAHAANAYEKVKRERAPKSAAAMWRLWIEEVQQRKLEGTSGPEGAIVPAFQCSAE